MQNLNLIGLKYAGHSNQHLSILIAEVHGEYPMPTLPSVTVKEIYNGYECDNILGHLAYPKQPKNWEADLQKVLDGVIRDYTNGANLSQIAFDTKDDTIKDSNLLRITFWASETNEAMETIIKEYMALLKRGVQQAMDTASGDDSYYDYMPSFVDQYRQLCQHFKGPFIQEYNDMVQAWLPGQEDPNIYTETIK